MRDGVNKGERLEVLFCGAAPRGPLNLPSTGAMEIRWFSPLTLKSEVRPTRSSSFLDGERDSGPPSPQSGLLLLLDDDDNAVLSGWYKGWRRTCVGLMVARKAAARRSGGFDDPFHALHGFGDPGVERDGAVLRSSLSSALSFCCDALLFHE